MTDDLLHDLLTAERGSRELDARLWLRLMQNGESMLMAMREAPHYTTNMQDTIEAVPEGWHIDCLTTGDKGTLPNNPAHRPRCILRPDLNNDDGWQRGAAETTAATPQLALSAAILKAKGAQDGS